MAETRKPRTIFFDLEAGGLSAHQSSILSISYGVRGEKIQSLYAAPAHGSKLYSWSEENVWKPIQSRLKGLGQKPLSERTALESFLGVLESEPAGGTLAGWNIGYERIAQQYGEQRSRGFDIPTLLTRSKAYGLHERYQKALSKFALRDIGQEYAWKLANEVVQHPELIEKDLFEQISGYVEAGRSYKMQRGATDAQTAKWLATGGYKVSGWKQELLHSVIFPDRPLQAHLSEEDVGAAMNLADVIDRPIFGGNIEKIRLWQEKALRNKFITSLRFDNNPGKIADILERSKAPLSATGQALPSIESGLMADIQGLAKSYNTTSEAILRGEELKESFSRQFLATAGKRSFRTSKFVSEAFEFALSHKVKLGLGAGAAALWIAKPLSFLSNKAEEYSAGEDLRNRKTYSPSTLASENTSAQERFNIFRKALPVYGENVDTGHKRILIPKNVISQEDLESELGFVPVKIAIPEAGQDTGTSWRNLHNNLHIHSHGDEWTMHEDEHAASTMLVRKWMEENKGNKETSIVDPIKEFIKGIPHVVTEGIPGLFYWTRSLIGGGQDMAARIKEDSSKEYLAVEQRLLKYGKTYDLERLKRLVDSRLSGKDDTHNTIEGLRHGGLAGEKRRELTDFGSGYRGDRSKNRFASIRQRFKSAEAFVTPFIEEEVKSAGTALENQKLIDSLLKAADLKRESIDWVKSEATSASYIFDDAKVTLPESAPISTFAHELGHHVNADFVNKSKAYKYLFTKGHQFTVPAMIAGGLLSPSLPLAMGLPLLVNAARLHHETIATKWGLQALKKSGYSSMAEASRNLIASTATYYSKPVLAAAGAATIWKMREAVMSDGNKQSATLRTNAQKDSSLGFAAYGAAGAVGGMAFWKMHSLGKVDLTKYPRLAALRAAGSKHGMKIASASMAAAIGGEGYEQRSLYSKILGQGMFRELDPVRNLHEATNFPGVVYLHQAREYAGEKPSIPTVANWGNWDIGSDKLTTWEYLQKHGGSEKYAPTLAGAEFYEGSGATAKLSDKGRQFIETSGGLENIVVKRRSGSLGEGVWTNATKLPSEIADEMIKNPGEFLLQQRLDLASEFRVITAGDKAFYTAHRFGTPGFKSWAGKLQEKLPAIPGIGKIRFTENIQPVLDKGVRERLISFAESAARDLPYEIGAFDIGMTKEGKFAVIEAQRTFGSITNPIVSRRLRSLVTGKPTALGIAAGVAAAGLTLGAFNLFSGKDDEYNTIEALRHQGLASQLRKEGTEFGSGWRGIVALPKALQKYFKGAGATARPAEMNEFLLRQIEGGVVKKTLRKIGIGKKSYEREYEALRALATDTKTSWEHMVYINPLEVARMAKRENLSVKQVLRGTIEHERFHQGLREAGILDMLQDNLSDLVIPQKWLKETAETYKKAGAAHSDEVLREEYIAHAITAKSTGDKSFGRTLEQAEEVIAASKVSIEQAQRRAAEVSPLPHRPPSQLTELNRRANVDFWTNAKSPGKKSLRKTGKIVQ